MKVPPGVDAGQFAQAIAQFKQIVGEEWVFTEDADVALYRDAYSILWGTPEERLASAAVCPQSTEEVQRVVRIANTYRIPIYPISCGRNLGYGGSAPNYSGSVVLDLKRMNRILSVDEARAHVLVEPGVSYFDLYRHFQEHNVRLVIDTPDPGWGSLIGNALDHGGGYLQAPYRNHFDSHCGMEVVLPNGELLRTGMGALPGAQSWQDYKFGVGPWIDGIFSQSNFGVVTKMGFWVMPMPDAFFSGTVFAYRRDDLSAMVEEMNYAQYSDISNGMPFLASPLYGGSTLVPRDQRVVDYLATQPGGDVSDEQLQAFGKANRIPYWSVILKFYGAERALRESWEYCKQKFAAKVPGVTFQDGTMWKFPLREQDIPHIHKPEFGVPSLDMFVRGARTPAHPQPDWGHIWFSPIIPRTGEAIFEANRVITQILTDYDLTDSYRRVKFSVPSAYWSHSFVLIYGFAVTRVPEKDRKTVEGIKMLISECAKHGWGEYRAAPALQETVVNAYSFNNHALLHFNETLKDAIDPNGILSAGRYGIWPKHLRNKT
ncbi:MAG TPA: FAD-binding oxidoreductase [Steroidobacteraceae bacterium]|nr:FAD-binding oxidoreductase [Steroidobacteraceae bacterium]